MRPSSNMPMRVAGAILAGGRAERLGGGPKGLIELTSGRSIVRHLIRQMRAAGLPQVLIIANEPEPYARSGATVLPDRRPGMGPVAGVEAALQHVTSSDTADGVLFLPCDMPNLSAHEIGRLLSAFQRNPAKVQSAVIRVGKPFPEPVCCALHRRLLPQVTAALDQKRLKIGRLWREIGVEEVEFDDPLPFFNINTPEDLAAWREITGSQPGAAWERPSSQFTCHRPQSAQE